MVHAIIAAIYARKSTEQHTITHEKGSAMGYL